MEIWWSKNAVKNYFEIHVNHIKFTWNLLGIPLSLFQILFIHSNQKSLKVHINYTKFT